jgi:predicted methyltransferase MtxX (methanogen marker protein 4)
VDIGSRKVIEHVHQVKTQVDEITKALRSQDVDLEAIRNELEHHVTFKWLITIAGGFGLAVVGGAWMMQERALKAIEDNRQQREAAITQIRTEQASVNARVESKIDGVYKFLIEGKPKAEVRAEVRAEEKAAEPPPKPINPLAPSRPRP